jgi:hypothetical protein
MIETTSARADSPMDVPVVTRGSSFARCLEPEPPAGFVYRSNGVFGALFIVLGDRMRIVVLREPFRRSLFEPRRVRRRGE